MSLLATILQYLSLVTSAATAVLSLFFEFTVQDVGATRKRLTSAGRWAFALIIFSTVISLGSTIAKDILDEQAQTVASRQNRRSDGGYASWCLSKNIEQTKNIAYKQQSILYVENRKEKIDQFLVQNYPHLRSSPSSELVFSAALPVLDRYRPPQTLFFSVDDSAIAHNVFFTVPDPTRQLRYVEEKPGVDSEMSFGIRTRMEFSRLLGSQISLGLSLKTGDMRQDDPSIWGKRPVRLPSIAEHLMAIDIPG
jgi:hypothetical protein